MDIAERYRDFAAYEATGRSDLYVELALGVAGDADLHAWLDGLPRGKRQPNLLFAAYRLVAARRAAGPSSGRRSASGAARSRP